MAILLQKLILPNMPQMHAGHGLLGNDATIFHESAITMAVQIKAFGWSAWRLFPSAGMTGNVGLLAALYAMLGPEPTLFIPINAAYHALGVLMIYVLGNSLLPGSNGRLGGLLAALLFLTFPSALVWYGQNHKDAFLIAGSLIALFSFLREIRWSGKKHFLIGASLMLLGLAHVAAMRPYMLWVFAAAFFCAWLGVLAHSVFSRPPGSLVTLKGTGGLVVVAIAMATLVPSGISSFSPETSTSGIQFAEWRWQKSQTLPSQIDHLFERVSSIRNHTIESGKKIGAGSIVDDDIAPNNASDMLSYLPRALVVGLFSPFPNTWRDRPTIPRVIGALETLLWYLLFPGVLLLIARKPRAAVFACLAFALFVLTVLSYVSPNVGTLHRIRYGPLFLLILMGSIGWISFLDELIPSRFSPRSQPVASNILSDGVAIPSGGRRAALGAGIVVFLITAIGYLGLVTRDLLLMNINGFGSKTDSLFAALLLPMFFVNVLTLPLGDSLTSGIQRLATTAGSRLPFLRAAISFSLILSGAACLILFEFSDFLFHSVLTVADSASSVQLLRLALPLLFLSGLAIAGNSILNSLNYHKVVASAQLLVPVCVIAAILIADKSIALYAAVWGMIFGQLANIFVVFLFAYRSGYSLRPGSITGLQSVPGWGQNFSFLVLAAFVINISNPINYWFAGKLAAGSVSTWAMGTKLVQLVSGLTAAIMSSVIAPYLAKLVSGGANKRLRDDVYLMLIAGTWLGILAALVGFAFSEPLISAAFPGDAVDPHQKLLLAHTVKLGALQIPFVICALLLIKLAAVTHASNKVLSSAIAGLAINLVLNMASIPAYGVVGMAAAWTISIGVSTLTLILLTRGQTGLNLRQVSAVIGSWLVLAGYAMALHFQNVAIVGSTSILMCVTLYGQWIARK